MTESYAPAKTVFVAENIPEALTERPQWINWRLETRGGKPTKVPYTPGTNRRASSTDLMTWRTFEEAKASYESGRYDGVGFCFCSADPFVGIDLDACRDPATGAIEEWARKVIDTFEEAYVEASPSGCGVHLIVRAVLRDGVKTKAIEVYGASRFFALTGVAP